MNLFLSKNGRFVTHNCFSKIGVLKPLLFIVFWGVRAFWAKLSKKGIFGHPPKNKKFLTDIWQAHFLIFFVLFNLFFVYSGPPHLALNPPYLFFLFCFFGYLFCFLGGLFFLSFLCLWVTKKKPVFPLKKGIFCLVLSVSLCFSWAFFGLPLVQFLFLCLSLVLFFLSSFLSLSFCFLVVPSSSLFLFLSSLVLFLEN